MTLQALNTYALICLLSVSAYAQDESAQDDAPVQDLAAPLSGAFQRPLWEAGLFGLALTQPAYPGADQRASRLLGLPFVIYRGKILRAEQGGVNLRALKSPRSELDVGFAAALGSHADDIPARRGMADLGTMIEFGPRLKIKLDDNARGATRVQFPLRAVIDVSHDFVSRGIAFEPQWVSDSRLPGRWFVSTSLGALFGDQKLADTYYGVSPAEATATRASYSASGGLIALRAGLFAAHTLTPGLRLICLLRIESLAGAANHDSPLVRRNIGWGAGIGLSWELARSQRYAQD